MSRSRRIKIASRSCFAQSQYRRLFDCRALPIRSRIVDETHTYPLGVDNRYTQNKCGERKAKIFCHSERTKTTKPMLPYSSWTKISSTWGNGAVRTHDPIPRLVDLDDLGLSLLNQVAPDPINKQVRGGGFSSRSPTETRSGASGRCTSSVNIKACQNKQRSDPQTGKHNTR